MSADLHLEAEALFIAALDLPPEERRSLLDERCVKNPALRAEAESLLAHHEKAAGFMNSPAICSSDEALAVGHEAAADAPRAPMRFPPRIGAYRVLSVLGEGGMAVVYLAEQDRPRRCVALKVLRPDATRPEHLHRFEKEAEILGRLHHPGIAQVFEAGTAVVEGRLTPYIAMERVEGRPLTAYADAAGLGARDRVKLFVKVCEAVDHAHQMGVIHRDLKPANILVARGGQEGLRTEDSGLSQDHPIATSRSVLGPHHSVLASAQPKVLDFGVARFTDADIRTTLQTSPGQLIGTIAYMSPEQTTGDPSQLDARSDVYALGVIGYELLTGQLPYDLRQMMVHEAVRVIRQDDAAPLSSLDPTSRGDLDTIFCKALEKEKPRRYPTARALAADLRRYLDDEPILARRTSAAYQLRKFARRHRGLVLGAGVVTALLVLATVGMSLLAVRAVEQRGRAQESERLADRRCAEAESAREDSEAVTHFLAGMLASINPAQLGREVLLRDALQEAARKVAEDFAEKPIIEGRLRLAIGDSYRSLGELGAAAEHAERAVEAYRRALGAKHADTLVALNSLAELRVDQGRRADAEAIHREVLAARREVLGQHHRETLTSLSNLADVIQRGGRYDEAEPLLREALESRRRTLGNDHAETLVSMNNMAMLLKNTGRPMEAEPLLRQVVEARGRLYGEEHPRTLTSMDNLAGALSDLGRPDEAEELYRHVLDARRRVLGDEHPDTLLTLSSLGLQLHYLGRHGEAETYLEESLRGRRKVLGDRHTRTLDSMNNLAMVRHAQRRLDEAAALMQEVASARREVDGPEHPRTLGAMISLGYLKSEAGQFAEAEQLLREGVEVAQRVLGADHPSTLIGMNRLAGHLVRRGDLEQALQLYAESVDCAGRSLPARNPHRLAAHAGYGACLGRLERWDDAEKHLLQAAEGLEASMGQAHPRTQDVITDLVDHYQRRGRAEQAALWRDKLAARE